MNREEFVKHKWRAYEVVIYSNDRMMNWDSGRGVELECMVCSIDFDEETVLLQPLIPDLLNKEEINASIRNIHLPPRKPKITFSK